MNKDEAKNKMALKQSELSTRTSNLMTTDHGLIKCRAEIARLQAIIDAPDVFEPVLDRVSCWLCLADGDAVQADFSDILLKLHGNQGSVWPTERLAKIASLRQKIQNYQAHYALQHCPDFVPDFSDKHQSKYSPYYDHVSNQVLAGVVRAVQSPNDIFFPASKLAVAAGEVTRDMEIELDKLIKDE